MDLHGRRTHGRRGHFGHCRTEFKRESTAAEAEGIDLEKEEGDDLSCSRITHKQGMVVPQYGTARMMMMMMMMMVMRVKKEEKARLGI
jgi:hypothetical protein